MGVLEEQAPRQSNFKKPCINCKKHSLHLTNEVPAKQMSGFTGTLVPCHHPAPEVEGSHRTKHLQRQLGPSYTTPLSRHCSEKPQSFQLMGTEKNHSSAIYHCLHRSWQIGILSTSLCLHLITSDYAAYGAVMVELNMEMLILT